MTEPIIFMDGKTEPLSQKEFDAFMDGLTVYLSSEGSEQQRIEAGTAVVREKLAGCEGGEGDE